MVARTYTNSSHSLYVEFLYIRVTYFCVKWEVSKIASVYFSANNVNMIKISNISNFRRGFKSGEKENIYEYLWSYIDYLLGNLVH